MEDLVTVAAMAVDTAVEDMEATEEEMLAMPVMVDTPAVLAMLVMADTVVDILELD